MILERLRRMAFQPTLAFWAGAALFVVLEVLAASGGVRGTDQYWYLADLEALLVGAPKYTNTLFPRELLRHGVQQAPFIHNILPQYIPLPFGYLLGAYWGWIATNILAMVLAAYWTQRALLRNHGPGLASFMGLLVLFSPLSLWLGSQVLAEAMLMPMFALAVLIVERRASLWGWGLLAVVLVLGFMSRLTGLALLAACPVFVLVSPQSLKRRVLGATLVLAIGGAGLLLNRSLLGGPSHEGENAIANAIMTRGMGAWYDTAPLRFTMGEVAQKVAYSLQSITRGGLASQAIHTTNLLFLGAAASGAVVAIRRRAFVFASFILAVLALNLATLLLYNSQARYVVPSYPALFVAAAYLVGSLELQRKRWLQAAGGVLMVGFVLGAVPMALRARDQAIQEDADRARLASLAKSLQGPGDIISLGIDGPMIAYSLRPRQVLYTRPTQTDEDWKRVLSMPRWRWVLSKPPLAQRLVDREVDLKLLQSFEFRGEACALYELTELVRHDESQLKPRR